MNNLEHFKPLSYSERFTELLRADNGAFLAEVTRKTADDMREYMSGDCRAMLRDMPEKDDEAFIAREISAAYVAHALYMCCKEHGLEPLMGPIQARQIGADMFAAYIVKDEYFRKAWKQVCHI